MASNAISKGLSGDYIYEYHDIIYKLLTIKIFKMKKETQKFDINKFKKLSTNGDVLEGGFSTNMTGGDGIIKDLIEGGINVPCNENSNTNCAGGNCVAGCGAK